MIGRAWMVRTSRGSVAIRDSIYAALGGNQGGWLRQGWGWHDGLDLRLIKAKRERGEPLGTDEQDAWRNSPMLGKDAGRGNDAIMVGDLVLLPNIPVNGQFSICEVTGDYQYGEPLADHGDFRHMLPVKRLGFPVANSHAMVPDTLRTRLKARNRIVRLHEFHDNLMELSKLSAKDAGTASSGVERVLSIAQSELQDTATEFADKLRAVFNNSLQAAEWEKAIAVGLEPLLREAEVIHTGGPKERGADLELRFPNPFDSERGWVVLIQVKDYKGKVEAEKAEQLEQAFTSRQQDDNYTDQIVEVMMVVTNAKPSEAMKEKLVALSKHYHIPFTFVEGEALMRAMAQGYLHNLNLFGSSPTT